jgi:hypothetical protein
MASLTRVVLSVSSVEFISNEIFPPDVNMSLGISAQLFTLHMLINFDFSQRATTKSIASTQTQHITPNRAQNDYFF